MPPFSLLNIRIGILSLFCLLCPTIGSAQSNDKAQLLKNVASLPMPVPPNYVCATFVSNEMPQIIASAYLGQGSVKYQVTTIASSRLGKGKILVLGSSWYFRNPLLKHSDVKQLLLNALDWAGVNKPKLQLYSREPHLEEFLKTQNLEVLEHADSILSKTDVLVLTTDISDTGKLKSLEQFITKGGTLIFGSPISDNINRSQPEAYNLKINQLFEKAGLVHEPVASFPQANAFKLNTSVFPPYLHINTILQQLEDPNFKLKPEELEAYENVLRTVASNPYDSAIINRIWKVLKSDPAPDLVPSPENPISKDNKNYLAYSLNLWLVNKRLGSASDPKYIAPASVNFPGKVPSTAKRVSRRISIKPGLAKASLSANEQVYLRWHSTGLYVPAGEVVTIRLNKGETTRHLQAQIGVHNDKLDHMDVLHREADDLTRIFELSAKETNVYSPYGGILMIKIPDTSSLSKLNVDVRGAVDYPYFKAGSTSVAQWKKRIRNYSAPWAELASDKIVLTVPAYRIRQLVDPDKVLKFWDAVVDVQDSLSHFSNRTYPERIITDQQVAYGYMFTGGYKIVIPDDESTPNMLNQGFMWKNGSWGHFHELGHRHQFDGLDFRGLGEVSVNLFTMYTFDRLLKKGLYNHSDIPDRQTVIGKIKSYMNDPNKGTAFTTDPFMALSMYIELIEGFGWGPIEKVYQQFRNIPRNEYPLTDQAKRDLWFVSICEATKKDLGVFFEKWNLPASKEARAKVGFYESWLPDELR